MRMVASSAEEHLNNDVLQDYGLFLEIKYDTGTWNKTVAKELYMYGVKHFFT